MEKRAYATVLLHDEITVQRSRKVLDNLVEGLHDHAIQYLENSSSMRRTFTYLLSVSEHGPEKLVPGTVNSESHQDGFPCGAHTEVLAAWH